MKCTVVLTERRCGNFHATVTEFPDCSIDAPTRNEALEQIYSSIQAIVSRSEIFQLEVATEPDQVNSHNRTPWEYFGKFKNDPIWGEVFDDIEK